MSVGATLSPRPTTNCSTSVQLSDKAACIGNLDKQSWSLQHHVRWNASLQYYCLQVWSCLCYLLDVDHVSSIICIWINDLCAARHLQQKSSLILEARTTFTEPSYTFKEGWDLKGCQPFLWVAMNAYSAIFLDLSLIIAWDQYLKRLFSLLDLFVAS